MKPQTSRMSYQQPATAFTAQRSVTLLGATGSIGASTVDLLKRERDRFRVEAVSANKNAAALAAMARAIGARFAVVGDPAAYDELKDALSGSGIAAGAGESALVEAAQRPADWVIGAITGAAGLRPTLAAADRGAIVALANKETLVCAGGLFMRRAAAAGATVLPVDSEHNALFQAMSGSRREDVRRVILTASGGPFRTASAEAIRTATVEQALKHPNWIDGRQGHDRFGDADEQGPGGHRGASPLRVAVRADRCAGPSAIDRAQPGRILRRLADRAARQSGHAHPHRLLPGLAGTHQRARRRASISRGTPR